MMRMMSLVLLAALAVGVARGQDACVPASGDAIVLGAVFPQEALLMASTVESYQGAQAMLAAVNACGGVNGRPVEWLYRPANSRASAEEAAADLAGQVPLVVGSGMPAISASLAAIAPREGFVYWDVTEAIASGEWVFSPGPTNQQLGSAAAQFVESQLPAVLGKSALRVAVVYEDRDNSPHGQQLANGVLSGLSAPPFIIQRYDSRVTGSFDLARDIRAAGIDVLIVGAFDSVVDHLWYALREVNANIGAWVQVGSVSYQEELCVRLGNNDGVITVHAAGSIRPDYLDQDAIFRLYQQAYVRAASREPGDRANRSAAGVYLLLRYVLPTVTGSYTPESIRDAIMKVEAPPLSGLLGEGLKFDPAAGVNLYPAVAVQQRQLGMFCTIWPSAAATCGGPVAPFPTWRERAIIDESDTCRDPA